MQPGGAGLQPGFAELQPVAQGCGRVTQGCSLVPQGCGRVARGCGAGLRHLAEAHGIDAGVARGGAGAADDVRRLQDLALGRALELVVLLLVGLRELAQLLLEHAQLAQLRLVRRVEVAHLVRARARIRARVRVRVRVRVRIRVRVRVKRTW